MNISMNIPETLDGIRNEDIPKLACYADKEANPLYRYLRYGDLRNWNRCIILYRR